MALLPTKFPIHLLRYKAKAKCFEIEIIDKSLGRKSAVQIPSDVLPETRVNDKNIKQTLNKIDRANLLPYCQ